MLSAAQLTAARWWKNACSASMSCCTVFRTIGTAA
jgi:hypothetical protein